MGRDQYHSSKRKLKYVPIGNETLVARGEHSVTFEESADKWSITRTFAISSHGEFLRCNLFIVVKQLKVYRGCISEWFLSQRQPKTFFSHGRNPYALRGSYQTVCEKRKTAPETLYRSEGSSHHRRFY